MPLTHGETPPSQDQPDWPSIKAEVVKLVTSRWPNTDPAEIEGEVHWGIAKACCELRRGKSIPHLHKYIATVANNNLTTQYHSRNRHEKKNADLDLATNATQTSPEQILLSKEFQQALIAAILSLPDEYRIPLIARFIKEYSYEEIAAIIGKSVVNTRVRVTRGRKLVRAKMEKRGY